MLRDENIKVGRYWDYSNTKINDNTRQEIKSVYEYQIQLLEKAKKEKWDIKDYNAFSSVIKQMKLTNFINCLNIHQSILTMSSKDVFSEIIYLLNKGVILPDPKMTNSYSMMAQMSADIQRKILQFSSCAISQNNANITNSADDKSKQYQEILNDLQNTESDYYKWIITSFKDWVNQTFQNPFLKETILTMQNYIIENNIRRIKQKVKIECFKSVTSQNELMKYKGDKRKTNKC